jgi:RNA polymerase sigma factor (sigma-70 family)
MLSVWRTLSDDKLILAFKAEIALPEGQQPTKYCATFELLFRALALRRNAPFEAFDQQYRRLVISWLRQTAQIGFVLAHFDGRIDDLVTMVYMRLFKRWHNETPLGFYQKFEGQPSRVFAYLQRTCTSTVISEGRKKYHEVISLKDEVALSSYTTDEWSNNRTIFYQRIQQLLDSEEQRLLELHMQGYSHAEIANYLNKPQSNIRRSLSKLFIKLERDPDLRALFDGSL